MNIQRRNGRVMHGEGVQRIWVPNRDPTTSSGLIDWFDAGQGITLNAGNVSQWLPRVTVANAGVTSYNLVQPTALQQPLYVAHDANFSGRPSIYLTGGRYLRSGLWSATVVQPLTYYIVAKILPSPNYKILVDGLTATSRCMLGSASNVTKTFAGSELGTSATSPDTHVYACEFSGATSTIFRSDSANAIASGNVGSYPLTGITLGIDYSMFSGATADSYVAELIVYSGVHSAVTRRAILRYLGNKYGIATS